MSASSQPDPASLGNSTNLAFAVEKNDGLFAVTGSFQISQGSSAAYADTNYIAPRTYNIAHGLTQRDTTYLTNSHPPGVSSETEHGANALPHGSQLGNFLTGEESPFD